jgi:hypothetical protein
MSGTPTVIAWSFLLLGLAACGDNAEGDACDMNNGNSDCESGLVCTPAHAVKAREAVCCPRPPATASVDACRPELDPGSFPDPDIDASFAAGGKGAGGTAGSAGAAGTGDATDGTVGDGATDARGEGSPDGAGSG